VASGVSATGAPAAAGAGAAIAAGYVAVGDPTVGRSVAPQLWKVHPRGPSQNIPIRASNGMTCPYLGEIGVGWGRGFSPVVFPAPLILV